MTTIHSLPSELITLLPLELSALRALIQVNHYYRLLLLAKKVLLFIEVHGTEGYLYLYLGIPSTLETRITDRLADDWSLFLDSSTLEVKPYRSYKVLLSLGDLWPYLLRPYMWRYLGLDETLEKKMRETTLLKKPFIIPLSEVSLPSDTLILPILSPIEIEGHIKRRLFGPFVVGVSKHEKRPGVYTAIFNEKGDLLGIKSGGSVRKVPDDHYCIILHASGEICPSTSSKYLFGIHKYGSQLISELTPPKPL